MLVFIASEIILIPFPLQSLQERFTVGALLYMQKEMRSAGNVISTCERVWACLFSVGVGLQQCG